MDVRLRDHRQEDLAAVVAWAGDPRVTASLTFGPLDEAGCDAWLGAAVAEAAVEPRKSWSQAIEVDGEIVGVVVIATDSAEHARAELGFAVRADRWGRGIASEAVLLAAELALGPLGFHRLWAVCDPDNTGASRALQAAGFVAEGRLRHDLRIGGRWRDSAVYARIDEQNT